MGRSRDGQTETYVGLALVQFSIHHRTSYRYSRPVYLEPHFLRVHPRTDPAQTVLEYALDIVPEPAGRWEGLDAEGNWLTGFWFDGLLDHLEVTAEFLVETRLTNPFDFLLTHTDSAETSDLYAGDLARQLRSYLAPAGCQTTAEMARSIPRIGSVLDYLGDLNRTVHDLCRVVIREHGDPWPPARTLREGHGACRDLAVVFIEACRGQGIAARFTSGFTSEGDVEEHAGFLHAWAEVYLPGAGWRGFDPTQALAVADHHVCVAAGCCHQAVAPVTGTFRGTDATSTMETEIKIARS